MSFSQGLRAGLEWGKDRKRRQMEEEIAALAGEKETTAFTQGQGDELNAIANAKDEAGNPFYKVEATPDGKYTVTPNFKNETGEAPTDYGPASIAAQGVNYMGKSFDAPLNDGQRTSARQQAIAGVMDKHDPEAGMRYRQQAKQGELTDLQIANTKVQAGRDDKRFGWEQGRATQEEADRTRENDYKTGRDAILAQSPQAQAQTQFQQQTADYQAQLTKRQQAAAAGTSPEALGPEPQAPKMTQVTPGQMLGQWGALIAHDAKFGKVSTEGMMNFAQKVEAMRKEGYGDAVRALQNGAPLKDVAALFDKSGTEKFDLSAVVSDKQVTDANGVPAREITIRGKDGSLHTINSLNELKQLDQAEKVLNQFYAAKGDKRADATQAEQFRHNKASEGISGGHLALARDAAVSTNRLHAAQADDAEQKGKDRVELATIREGLTAAIDSGDKKAEDLARKKLMGYSMSGKGPQLSDTERKANFYLASGVAKTPEEAATMAHQKVQSSPKDDYLKMATAPMPLAKDAIDATMEVMHGANWKSKMQAEGGAKGELPKPKSQAELAKLPKGARYIAPDGTERVKQR